MWCRVIRRNIPAGLPLYAGLIPSPPHHLPEGEVETTAPLPGRQGTYAEAPQIVRHVELRRFPAALGHEFEQAVETPELEGLEQRPVAPRVARAYVDQD